jgi:hypothetical protein
MFEMLMLMSPTDDGGEGLPHFEDETPEVVIVDSEDDIPVDDPEADLPDEIKKKSKMDLFKQLEKQSSSEEVITNTLKEGFESLGSKIGGGFQGPAVSKEPEFDEAELKKSINKNIWEGDVTESLDKYFEYKTKGINQKFQEVQQQQFDTMVTVLKKDPESKEIFDNNAEEVANRLSTYDPKYQRDPRVLVKVIDDMKKENLLKDPSKSPTYQSAVDAAVAKRLEELGIDPDKIENDEVKPTFTNVGRRKSTAKKGTKKVYVTKQMQEAAMRVGMPVEAYVRWCKENK